MTSNWKTTLTCSLSLALMGLAVVNATAQTTGLSDNLKDIKISRLTLLHADMLAATLQLKEDTGLSFVILPSDKPFNPVTIDLQNTNALDAIKYIVTAAGAYVKQDENGVFLISQTPFEVKTPLEKVGLAPADTKIVRKVNLLHADPKIVYEFLVGKNPVDGGFYDLRARNELLNMNSFTDPNAQITQLSKPTPVQWSTPEDARPISGGNNFDNGVQLPNTSAKQLGGGGGIGGGGGFGGQGGGIGGQGGGIGGGGGGLGGGGQNGGANVPQLQGGQGLVPDGIDQITYDPSDNSILVYGTDEAIKKIKNTIAILDVEPKQVLIKVEFITTTSSLSKDLGFDWLYQRGTIFAGNAPGTFANTGDPIFLNYANGNVTTRLRTNLVQGYGKTISSPLLRTLNNQPAQYFSVSQTFIEITQTTALGNGNFIQTRNPTPLTAQTNLTIAPRINGDGTITVNIAQQNQGFGQLKTFPDGQQAPDINTQVVNVVAKVKNGETIVLAGSTSQTDTGSVNKFPILADLPIIGQFFRSTNRQKNESELLIFITPTIVTDQDTTSDSGI